MLLARTWTTTKMILKKYILMQKLSMIFSKMEKSVTVVRGHMLWCHTYVHMYTHKHLEDYKANINHDYLD